MTTATQQLIINLKAAPIGALYSGKDPQGYTKFLKKTADNQWQYFQNGQSGEYYIGVESAAATFQRDKMGRVTGDTKEAPETGKTAPVQATTGGRTAREAFAGAPAGTVWTGRGTRGDTNGQLLVIKKEDNGRFSVGPNGAMNQMSSDINSALDYYKFSGNVINTANRAAWSISPPSSFPAKDTVRRANGAATATATATASANPPTGLQGPIDVVEAEATVQDQTKVGSSKDWRVRLSLSPGSTYLYNAPDAKNSVLAPLAKTEGVIFPYTPKIGLSYAAEYGETKLTHSNYKIHQYIASSVDQITISAEFTCQDVFEARYLIAVIHFFRSMTKMFYGQDEYPIRGTPPPLCYMYGLGDFQFQAHPLAITSLTYTLPPDVDYIRTTAPESAAIITPSNLYETEKSIDNQRQLPPEVGHGGVRRRLSALLAAQQSSPTVTWVPTKIELAIAALPIISRNQISNEFSLKEYATGNLMLGSTRAGGGMW